MNWWKKTVINSPLKKNTEKLNIFIIIETILCIVIVYTTCFQKIAITSLTFSFSFIVLLLQMIIFMSQKDSFDIIDVIMLLIIILSFINVIISTVLNQKIITFDYLSSYFIFIATILFFRLAENIKIGKKTCTIIFLFQFLICFIYIYTHTFKPQALSEYSSNALTLGFSNPNLTGMFLLQSALFMVLSIFYFKNFFLRVLGFILTIIMLKYILETEARNVLISFTLFLGIIFLCFFKTKLKFSKLFIFLVNIAPTVFVPIYLTYIKVIIESGWFDFLVSEGKNLNSRVRIWRRFFNKLGDYGFIGNYATSAGNSHNSSMVLICSFGYIVLGLVTLFNCLLMHRVSQRITTKFQTFCLAAFFAVIFMGFGEGALYSGGVGIYILCGTFLMLANSEIIDNDFKKGSFFVDKSRL